jgi:hypothetical protein
MAVALPVRCVVGPGDVVVDADVLWEPIPAAKEAVLQRNTLAATSQFSRPRPASRLTEASVNGWLYNQHHLPSRASEALLMKPRPGGLSIVQDTEIGASNLRNARIIVGCETP